MARGAGLLLAAAGGGVVGAHPAGLAVADAALAAGFAVLVAAAASRARRWTWLVLAGAAASLASGSARLAGVGALMLAVVAVGRPRRDRTVGVAVGGLAVQALLRLPGDGWLLPGVHGASALAAGLAVAPVLISAYRRLGRRARRRARVWTWATGGVTVAATGAFAASLAAGRPAAVRGLDEVRAGLAMAAAGDRAAAPTLAEAARTMAAARARLAPWWAMPARAVPLIGLHQRAAVSTIAEEAALARAAAAVASTTDLGRLSLRDGTVDLGALAAADQPLRAAAAALARAVDSLAGVRSPWLAAPVAERVDELAAGAAAARRDVDTARAVLAATPGLLGSSGPRRYVVAFVTPAESRGSGGYMGSFGEVTAEGGRLALTRSGRTLELIAAPAAPPRPPSGPVEYLRRYGRFTPHTSLGDVGYSPDFPTVAQVLEEQYERATGTAVGGAVSVDPYALAALLELTGPVAVPGLEVPLTAANAADVLLRQQYARFPDGAERVGFLAGATGAVLERLTTGPLPDLRTVARTLAPVVRQGRLMVHSARPSEQAVLRRLGLDGRFPAVGGGDFFSLVTQNSANNKIDVFLRRSVDYRARFDPATGAVAAEVAVTLGNDAPAAGLPWYVIGSTDPTLAPGTNRLFVSVYTPHRLVGADLDGQPLAMETARELGRLVHSAFVAVGPGQRRTLRLRLAGAVPAGEAYRLALAPQPLVNPDAIRIDLEPAPGWRVAGGGSIGPAVGGGGTAVLAPEGDTVLAARLRR